MKQSAPLFSLLLALALVLPACGGGSSQDPAGEPARISPTTADVIEGGTITLSILPTQPGSGTWIWSTADPDIAVVDPDGTVHGRRPGEVLVVAEDVTGTERAEARVRVRPDTTFNATLPTNPDKLVPTFDRQMTPTHCTLRLGLEGVAATLVTEDFRRYHELALPLAGATADEGRPAVPFFPLYFAIPVDAKTREPATPQVEVRRTNPRAYEGIRPWPAQADAWLDGDPETPDPRPPFAIDEKAYASPAAYPAVSHVADVMQIGNLHVLEVKVFPAVYVGAEGRLDLYREVEVEVVFSGDGDLVLARPLGDYKGRKERGPDQWVHELVQNRELMDPLGSGDLVASLPPIDSDNIMDDPFDLLIITRPALETEARRLARWRQDHGTRVWLAVCNDTDYPDAPSIRDLIERLDDRNRIECSGGERPHGMSAICIVGDVEIVPTCQGMNVRNAPNPAPGDDPVLTVGTDFLYTNLRGLDWRADVSIGRISVDDGPQASAVLDKIEAYEGLPTSESPHHMAVWGYFDDTPSQRCIIRKRVTLTYDSRDVEGTGTHFRTEVEVGDLIRPNTDQATGRGGWSGRVATVDSDTELTLEADFTGTTTTTTVTDGLQVASQDGQDNWEFVRFAEYVRQWMLSQGVEVEFGYTRRDGPTPVLGFHGEALAADLLTYDWNATTGNIQDDWRRGRNGIILHSDHGHPEGWGDPEFDLNDLEGYDQTSEGWYPIVLSINCSSGWFDAETDTQLHDDGTYRLKTTGRPWHTESFCEAVLREPFGGGVASFGACRGSDAGKNGRLIEGIFSAFYADYEAGALPQGPGSRYAFERLGAALLYGKFRMRAFAVTLDRDDAVEQADYNMQTYHLFGDPMLPIRPPVAD